MDDVGPLNSLYQRVLCSAEFFQSIRHIKSPIFAVTHSMIRHYLKPCGVIAEAGQKSGGRLDIRDRIIYPWDKRLAEQDVYPVLQEQRGISKDLSIGLPRVLSVSIRIHVLQIK